MSNRVGRQTTLPHLVCTPPSTVNSSVQERVVGLSQIFSFVVCRPSLAIGSGIWSLLHLSAKLTDLLSMVEGDCGCAWHVFRSVFPQCSSWHFSTTVPGHQVLVVLSGILTLCPVYKGGKSTCWLDWSLWSFMLACCRAIRSLCSMGAGMLRCGRSVAIGLPKIISPGDGNPVSIGVTRKFSSVSCISSRFRMVFLMIGSTQ